MESPTSTIVSPKHAHLSLPTLPPDVNTSEPTNNRKWYSRLYIPWALIYIPRIILMIIFGVLALAFGLKAENLTHNIGRKGYRIAFWICFAVFLYAVVSVPIALFVQFIMLPSFWRKRVKAAISPNNHNKPIHEYKTVLEVGCNDGRVSALFAREMIAAQRDPTDRNLIRRAPNPVVPIFIGYDMWKGSSRLPNTPEVYLQTLLDANVPRDHIIANRANLVDLTSNEAKPYLHLPYADNSISLIICSLGLSEVCKWYSASEEQAVFRELARILEPGGRMIILQNSIADCLPPYMLLRGPMAKYRRILVSELGWSEEKAQTHWAWGVLQYLDATKPVNGTKLNV